MGLDLVHHSVSSYDVVCLGSQASQSCGGIWFHFLYTEICWLTAVIHRKQLIDYILQDLYIKLVWKSI